MTLRRSIRSFLAALLSVCAVPFATAQSLQPIINPGFELSSSEGGWQKVGTGSTSVGTSTSPMPVEGTHVLRLSVSTAYYRQALYAPVAGRRYRVSAWIYNHGRLGIEDLGRDSVKDTVVTAATVWKSASVEFIATGSPVFITARYGPASGNSYFDLFEAEDVTTPADLLAAPPVPVLRFPSQVFDHTLFKITLPINDAQEVYAPELLDLSLDPWFRLVQDADGPAVQFRANHGGATTSGSKNPRSELREMVPYYHYQDSKSAASWSNTSGTHTMWIRQKVTRLTSVKPHVVLGQIHDAGDDVAVFRLEGLNGGPNGNGGTVGVLDTLAKLWITDGDNTHGYLVDPAYRLGTLFTVKFIAHDGMIEFEYNEKRLPYKKVKAYSGCYFKAGTYTQSNATTAPNETDSAYAESYLYDCRITHQLPTAVRTEELPATVPHEPVLMVHPNPFNPTATITFRVDGEGPALGVDLTLYDMAGRSVRSLQHGSMEPGRYSMTLDGNGLASGAYMVVARINGKVSVQRVLLMK